MKLSKQVSLTFNTANIAKGRDVVKNGKKYILYLYFQLFTCRNEIYTHGFISNKISVRSKLLTLFYPFHFQGRCVQKFLKKAQLQAKLYRKSIRSVLRRDFHQEFVFYKSRIPVLLNNFRLNSCFGQCNQE